MNRFTAAGIAAAAQAGESILVLTDVGESLNAFDTVHPHITAPTSKSTRASGGSRIEFANGGGIRFRTYRQERRGFPADVVYLDSDVPEQDLDELTPIVAASRIGEIIID